MLQALRSAITQPQLLPRALLSFIWAVLGCAASATYAQAPLPDEPPKSITVVMDDDYPPFIFRDASGKLQGILQDSWALWEKRTGIAVKLQAMDWAKALQVMQAGQADVIDTIFVTEARKHSYDFSAPYAQLDVPIFFHQSIGGIVNVDSLKGFKVGVKAGDACIDVLHAHGVDTTQQYPSYSALIAAAAASEVRVFCVDHPPAVYLLNQRGIEKEFRHSVPLYTGQFHRAVRKGNGALLKVVEDGFVLISASERQAIERKWYGTEIEGPVLSIYATYAAYALFGLLLLALILALWSLMLRQRVHAKTAELSNSLAALNHEKQITDQTLVQMKAAQEALRASELQFRATFEQAAVGISHVALDGRWLRVNQKLCDITGYTREELLTRRYRDITHPDDLANNQELERHLLTEKIPTYAIEKRYLHKSGRIVWVRPTVSVVNKDSGEPDYFISVIQDITERKAAQDEIQSLAFSDPLTGLPNRRLLLDRIKHAMAASARHPRQGALLFIDMDDFKTLNDSLGHDKGDQLLQQIAQRVLTCVRESDTVARLGGDEFVVVLEDLDESPQEAAAQAEAVARKIHHALRQTYQLDSHSYHSSASIGITLFGGVPRESIEEPLKRAELAMYKAKAIGRDNLRFFEPEMRNSINARASLEADLHEALSQSQFLLYYQAQVDADAHPTGVEALVRWQHPKRGLMSPGEFIPVAEASGLILPLGRWVLETACKQLAAWAIRPEMADLTISVNVSARQFRLPDFVEDVVAVLEATGANPKRLKLELTESLLLDNMKDIITKMNALKSKGVGFSLDDFGTGYSSLAYLKRLPLDELKIDQSFVRDILTDPNDAAIAKMVVALAASMGLAVIAEGVETQAQRDALDALGCHAFQGYWFSRPLPIQEFEAFARQA